MRPAWTNKLGNAPTVYRTSPLIVVLAISTLVGPLDSQMVEGRLISADGGSPVVSTPVVLVHDSLGDVDRSITDEDGLFRLPIKRDGLYSLHAELVGFDASPSPQFFGDTARVIRVDYPVILRPVSINAPAAQSTQCRPAEGSAASLAWRESRKALRAVRETARSSRLAIRAHAYQRVIRLDGRIARENDSIFDGLHGAPFVDYASEDVSDQIGFVLQLSNGSEAYAPPDPAVFLSDAFAELHCLWLDDRPEDGFIALRFEPRNRHVVGGAIGTFALHSESGKLDHISYRLPNEDFASQDAQPAGQLHFIQLSSADWFVKSWELREPILKADTEAATPEILGFSEDGVQVLEVVDAAGNQSWSDASIAVLYGSVYDSLTATPLQEGVVAISGTQYSARTDNNGGFALAGYFDGSYDVVFGHQRLDSLGFVSPAHTVELRRGMDAMVSLAVPPMARMLTDRCPEVATGADRKVLLGVVRDGATQQPVPGALVSISRDLIPQEYQRFTNDRSQDVVISDSLGMYTVCGVPVGVTIAIAATKGDKSSSFLRAEFGPNTVRFDDHEPIPLAYPIGRLDMTVRSVADYTARLTGIVTDDLTGVGLSGVTVSVEGSMRAVNTDSIGLFVLANLPDGPVQLSFRKLGYRMLRHVIQAETGAQTVLSAGSIVMARADPDAVTLDPIRVEAKGVTPKLSGFEERRSTGFGSYLTKEDFEDWHPTHATDVLRRMRGVRVRPNPFYGTNGDTRRHLIEPSRDIGQRITRVITTSAERGTTSFGGGQNTTVNECPMLLFLDGVYLGDSYTTDVDDVVSTTDLSAVEVYSPAQVPARFALPGATCGVAVFWSY